MKNYFRKSIVFLATQKYLSTQIMHLFYIKITLERWNLDKDYHLSFLLVLSLKNHLQNLVHFTPGHHLAMESHLFHCVIINH